MAKPRAEEIPNCPACQGRGWDTAPETRCVSCRGFGTKDGVTVTPAQRRVQRERED